MNGLDRQLITAHALNDRAGLVTLYTAAANAANDIDAACFFLTHAYVFGLETDHPMVPALYARLEAQGRV